MSLNEHTRGFIDDFKYTHSVIVVVFALGGLGSGGRVAGCTGPGAKDEFPIAEFEAVVEKNVKIAMRDGVRWRPTSTAPREDGKPVEGRFPTLLTRTPYNKDGAAGEGQYYAGAGYMVVANDVRGRYASEGTWRLIADDPQDGFEVVEWIARAGVVRRQGRHLRHELSRGDPARPGRDEPAAPDDDGPDRRACRTAASAGCGTAGRSSCGS